MVRIWSYLASVFLILTATSPSAQEENLVAKGRTFAESYCAGCHAVGLTGDSPHAEAPPFRIVAAKYPLEDLEEALAEGIVTGHPDMPAIELDPPNIEVLIEYLYTLLPDESQGVTGAN